MTNYSCLKVLIGWVLGSEIEWGDEGRTIISKNLAIVGGIIWVHYITS